MIISSRLIYSLQEDLLILPLTVRSLIIERYPERLGAPKAHAINPRSLEILRQYRLGEKRIRSLGTARADGYWVNLVTSLSGDAVGRIPYERMDVAVLEDTPEVLPPRAIKGNQSYIEDLSNGKVQMIHNLSQPVLEEELTRLIENDPNITLKKGYSIHGVLQVSNTAAILAQICSPDDACLLMLIQGEDEVIATVKETRGENIFRHMIACDGQKSRVRELLEIPSEGEDSDQTMMTIHFNANLRPVTALALACYIGSWTLSQQVSSLVTI